MKHVKPISKASSDTDASSIVTLVVSIVSALAPVIAIIVNAGKGTEKSSG